MRKEIAETEYKTKYSAKMNNANLNNKDHYNSLYFLHSSSAKLAVSIKC